MKRPRRRGKDGGGDEETPGEDESTSEAAKRPAPEAGKDVRRRLADRVGKASGEPSQDEAEDGRERDEPAKDARTERPKAKPKGGTSAKENPKGGTKPAAAAARDRKRADGGKESSEGGDGKKLNRPRPQKPAAAGRKAGPESVGPKSKPKSERPRSEPKDDRGREKRRDEKGGTGKREDEGRRRRERERNERDRRRGQGERGKKTRRERPPAGKRARAGATSFAAALKRGAIDTRKWTAANAPKVGRAALAGLGAVFALFFEVLGFVLNIGIAAWRVVARPVRAVLAVLDRGARATSRVLTPTRVLTIVVAGAAVLLALSQYADYRSISIGNGAYADVQSLAPAPETGRLQTGDAHSYVFVPVAIACLLLLAAATIGGRWRACRLIALAGFAAVVVAVLVDRPAGLDPGDAALAFEGVQAKLIGGFYAQIAAGVLLIGSSSVLARELRLAGAARRVPARREAEREEPKPKLRRRAPGGTEGTARA